ncbi:MAG TPA: zf-HC2 domain-containing protein [Candidatus Krumholzibacteria bacterium]|nr:zf-HC2 domain-containing protein [Candidatus Krumholzibacteria bacterium]
MMQCKEIARLLSEAQDRKLSWRERIGLRMHVAMCRMCQIYSHQLATLTRVYRAASDRAPECCPGELGDSRKQRIKDALKSGPGDA